MSETEIIDKLFLELSQFTQSRPKNELELLTENRRLRGLVNVLADRLARYTGRTVPCEIESASHPKEHER